MVGPVLVGAVCGLAWAAALRAYMAELNGLVSEVDGVGTFVGVLLPGVLVGAGLGAAAVQPRTARTRLRWLAACPLLFAIVPLAFPGALVTLLTTGLGGGAVAVALGGIAGGYALGGRRLWARIVCGILPVALLAGIVVTVPLVGGPRLSLTDPRGAWVACLVGALLVVLMIAASLPFRRLRAGATSPAAGWPVRTRQNGTMRATYLFAPGDVRVVDVPDPVILQPTDAIVRVVAACVCGSDLHPYRKISPIEHGTAMGHEFVGLIEELGSEVTGLAEGDFVIAPFVWSDGTCDFCREGLQTSCRHGGGWGSKDVNGGQGEAVRVPFADGTLVKVPAGFDPALVPDLLTLSDVYSTGFHAAATAGVRPGMDVTVIGDGAVGLLAVLAARELGAERIVLMGHHEVRTDLGRAFGATDVVAERGEEGIARVKDLTGGDGTHAVLEAVGYLDAFEQALGIVRAGGTVSRVGVPQYTEGPIGRVQFGRNVTITGGIAPARAYIERLLPGVLDGSVHPGRVFDRELPLEEAPEGYRLMNEREALKVLLRPQPLSEGRATLPG